MDSNVKLKFNFQKEEVVSAQQMELMQSNRSKINEQFSILLEGVSKGLEMPWNKIKRLLENDKVFVLFWDSEQAYVILPKRVLQSEERYVKI